MENPFAKIFTKAPDTLASQHLEKGVSPIFASLIGNENIDTQSQEAIDRIKASGDTVDWQKQKDESGDDGPEYLLSEITPGSKFSKGYIDCTGIIAVGASKENPEENISFLTHEVSWPKFPKSFSPVLERHLKELRNKSKEKSIDIVIFGGDYSKPYREKRDDSIYYYTPADDYEDAIKALSKKIREIMGFDPVIITGPNLGRSNATDAYFDTQTRRLYIVKPELNRPSSNPSFRPKDLKKVKKTWDNEFK